MLKRAKRVYLWRLKHLNKFYLKLLVKELKIGNAHTELSEKEWLKWAKREYNTYTNDDLKLIIAHCVYNEEDFILECLENDLKIVDLDAIHILDGAWCNGGKREPISTDRTFEIIKEFQKKTDIPIYIESHPTNDFWSSEGEKRNYQLKQIEKLFPDKKAYAFIKDADEILLANNGRETYWLKGSLSGWYPDVALLTAYAYNSSVGGDGCRFIPLEFGIHYYTEKTMIIHDAVHNTIIDYNSDDNSKTNVNQITHQIFNFSSYRLINMWQKRSKERLKEKAIFDKFRVTQINNTGNCKCEVNIQ